MCSLNISSSLDGMFSITAQSRWAAMVLDFIDLCVCFDIDVQQ